MVAHRGQRSLRHSEIAFLQVGPAGESQAGMTAAVRRSAACRSSCSGVIDRTWRHDLRLGCDDGAVPTLNDLARSHTSLADTDIEWLHSLVSDWQLLADLSFADLILWAPGQRRYRLAGDRPDAPDDRAHLLAG